MNLKRTSENIVDDRIAIGDPVHAVIKMDLKSRRGWGISTTGGFISELSDRML